MLRHGTNRGWEAGCRKKCCDLARKNHNKTQRRIHGAVQWAPAAEASATLSRLRHQGMSLRFISIRTGLSTSRLEHWANGRVSFVRREDLDRLRSIKVQRKVVPGDDRILAVGARRRLQDLHRRGFSDYSIASHTGLTSGSVHAVRTGGQKTLKQKSHDAIKEFLDRAILWPEPTGAVADRARAFALEAGYRPFGHWPDIDDPDSEPDIPLGDEEREKPKTQGVEEVVARGRSLAARGFQVKVIAAQAGMPASSLYKILYGERPGTKPDTLYKILDAYDKLEPLPDPEGGLANKTRTTAAKRGWTR